MTTMLIALVIAMSALTFGAVVVAISRIYLDFTLKRMFKRVGPKLAHEVIRTVRIESEKLKEYAMAYDLDNSHGVDTIELYLMGQKMEEALGEDSFTEVVHQTINAKHRVGDTKADSWALTATRQAVHVSKIVAKNTPLVSTIVSKAELITKEIVDIINAIRGGDRNGEPTSIQA
jgi:hypothetical protein